MGTMEVAGLNLSSDEVQPSFPAPGLADLTGPANQASLRVLTDGVVRSEQVFSAEASVHNKQLKD
ncbi:MAG TPA: hypothetical protein DCM67_00015 [Propionibacteriaceae bacterium]|nr:hypothetical protein [Propionibacteriaceae bacterium]